MSLGCWVWWERDTCCIFTNRSSPSTQTTHTPHANLHSKAPIRLPITLQAAIALSRVRSCTFLIDIARCCAVKPTGKLAPRIINCHEDLRSEMSYRSMSVLPKITVYRTAAVRRPKKLHSNFVTCDGKTCSKRQEYQVPA